MKKTKIRKEVKYSPDEWNKVCKLAKESKMLPAAYIRDKAVNGKIVRLNYNSFGDDFRKKRDAVFCGINEIAKTVNTEKEVFRKDVDDVEKVIDDLGELAENGLRPFSMTEVDI